MGGEIYLGDCRDALPSLPKVDLVLTDFPYGNGTDYDTYSDTKENLQKAISDIMPLIKVGADRALITCGVDNIGLYPKPDWIIAWVTPAGSGSGKWGFCCWQPILAYGRDPFLSNRMGRRPDIIFKTEITKSEGHPCAKPIDLWQLVLLRGSVKESDIILDPFMGSGTTAIAAQKLNRYFIGVELSEKYCEIAAKRLQQTVMKLEIPDIIKPVQSKLGEK